MGKGQIVTFTQGLGRLGRKGRDKKVIAVGQDQDEVMGLLGHATSDHTSLPEISLPIARRMIKRHKHFPGHPAPLSDVILDYRLAALIAVLIPQTVKYSLGRMPLLLRSLFIVGQDLVDDPKKWTQFGPPGRLASTVTRRNRMLQHLGNRPPVNTKSLRRLPTAQPLYQTGSAYSSV